MSNASVVDYAIRLAGIFALSAGTTVLATEDRNSIVAGDDDRNGIVEKPAPDGDAPGDPARERTLDLMLMIWSLKTTSDDTL